MLRSSTSSNQVSSTSTYKGFTVLFTFVLFSFLTACSPKDTAIAPQAVESADLSTSVMSTNQSASVAIDSNATLKSVASFPIGVATGSWLAKKSPKGFKQFEDQFNSKTVYAYMNIESTPGKFDFSELDYWVKWAETHPVRLHGHCLVYQGAAPDWILNFKGTNDEFERIIKNHIQTIVGRYKGKVKSWDVVNELINDKDGTMFMRVFRKMYASDAAYTEFVKHCFQWAHEADPAALLFYNDYNFEIAPAKVEGIIRLVNEFKRTGTPIDGIGSQMHIDINTPEVGIRSSLQRLATTGLMIHVSELDIMINPNNNPALTITNQLLNVQKAKFQAVALAYKQAVPTQQQYGITVWDLCDADSWIVVQKKQYDAPSLFDASYNKKAAFYGFLQGLKQ